MKNSLERFKGIFEQAEERISELEDRTIEIVESEEQKEKRLKKSEQSLRELWDNIKQTDYMHCRRPSMTRERKGQREYLKKQCLKTSQIW